VSHSSTTKTTRKPAKPYEGFPMFAHPSGMWAKKIRGKLIYFTSWRTDPGGTDALQQLNREWPYLKEGKAPPSTDVSGGCTLKQLCNDFLRSKEAKLNDGELSPRTFRDYFKTCEGLLIEFGRERRVDDLRPDDFRAYRSKLAKRFGVVSLKNEINRCCILFNYAHENNLIEKPVSYGQNFDRPSAKVLRGARNKAGANLFEREEVFRILDALAGNPIRRAMVLLGINCGFGNTDIASLPQSAVNLETAWIDFPRVKTEIPRRVPLWVETVDALREAIALRPAPFDADGRGLCFLTRDGRPWVRVKQKEETTGNETETTEEKGPEVSVPIDALSPEFKKLLHKLGINGRKGLGFYTLRHCFETQAGESKDQVAVDSIMGHVDNSMAANYRHRISDDRLKAVVDTVRAWLFPASPSPEMKGGAA